METDVRSHIQPHTLHIHIPFPLDMTAHTFINTKQLRSLFSGLADAPDSTLCLLGFLSAELQTSYILIVRFSLRHPLDVHLLCNKKCVNLNA